MGGATRRARRPGLRCTGIPRHQTLDGRAFSLGFERPERRGGVLPSFEVPIMLERREEREIRLTYAMA